MRYFDEYREVYDYDEDGHWYDDLAYDYTDDRPYTACQSYDNYYHYDPQVREDSYPGIDDILEIEDRFRNYEEGLKCPEEVA